MCSDCDTSLTWWNVYVSILVLYLNHLSHNNLGSHAPLLWRCVFVLSLSTTRSGRSWTNWLDFFLKGVCGYCDEVFMFFSQDHNVYGQSSGTLVTVLLFLDYHYFCMRLKDYFCGDARHPLPAPPPCSLLPALLQPPPAHWKCLRPFQKEDT